MSRSNTTSDASISAAGDHEVALGDIADRIRAGLRRTGSDIVAIGADLLAAKEMLGHGRFAGWLEQQFGLSQRSAERFMAAARRFGDRTDAVSNLLPGVLHELSAPGTPDEVVERVISGDLPPTVEAVRAAARSGRRRNAHYRAVRGLVDELWDLPDGVEEAAEAIAHDVLKEDEDFASWVAETLHGAAYLIDEDRGQG